MGASVGSTVTAQIIALIVRVIGKPAAPQEEDLAPALNTVLFEMPPVDFGLCLHRAGQGGIATTGAVRHGNHEHRANFHNFLILPTLTVRHQDQDRQSWHFWLSD